MSLFADISGLINAISVSDSRVISVFFSVACVNIFIRYYGFSYIGMLKLAQFIPIFH